MLDSQVFITTYERPQQCARLVDSLYASGYSNLVVGVDRGSADYSQLPDAILYSEHYGKQRYIDLTNDLILKHKQPASYYLFLQDDVQLCAQFRLRVEQYWSSIKDPRAVGMALLKTDVWASPKWTKVKPKVYNDLVYKVGALDMAALVIAPWALDWIWPVESNQSIIKQGRGSGLGQKITIKSHRAGRGMYLTAHSLVRHREPESVMHPGTRRATEVDFIDD